MDNKLAFFNKLEEIYLGNRIKEIVDVNTELQLFTSSENESYHASGFTNLLSIKKQYFNKVEAELLKEKTNDEIYNVLNTFFSVYLNETGTPYFNSTPLYKNVSAKIYSNNEDTGLFYKTKDLYYVKSDVLYKSLEVAIGDYKYNFDASSWKQAEDNKKPYLEVKFKKIEGKTLYFKVVYKYQKLFTDLKNIVKEKTNELSDDILKVLKQHHIDEDDLKKAVKDYKKQNEIDFFVHKDARSFLREQFNQYLYNYLFNNQNIDEWAEERIKQIQDIKKVAFRTIDLIADFENELRAMWLKPKFAKNTNYIISFDEIVKRLGLDYAKSIITNEQIDEWIEIEAITEKSKVKLDKDCLYPIDTKYLSNEDKYKILSSIDDLDNSLCGEVIKADNFQALNTIQNKYKGKLDLIYIDPPFNTGSDFIYKDKFQDSTWLTLMENRLSLSKDLLSERGSFYLHLDENADYLGRIISSQMGVFKNQIVWNKGFRGTESKGILQHAHDTIFYYTKSNSNVWSPMTEEYKDVNKGRYNQIDEDGRSYALIKRNRSDGSYYYGKTYPKDEGKSANDVISWVPTMASTNKQRLEFKTQKPEELMQIIIEMSSLPSMLVCDYFSGSATTITTAYKLKRKFLGVEMGEHFYDVVLPRLKKAMYGYECGISKDLGDDLNKGGIIKYYELESYEETLRNAEYINDEHGLIDYNKSRKLIKELKKGEKIKLDLSKYDNSIDIFTSISNITGLNIVKLEENQCKYSDGSVITKDNLDLTELSFLKKFIYWSNK